MNSPPRAAMPPLGCGGVAATHGLAGTWPNNTFDDGKVSCRIDAGMKAREIMTRDVVSVRPGTPVQVVAKLLSDRGISAVPVVDDEGAPIGMVSEGDLIGRDETSREARRDWWLDILAEGETLNADFVASLGHSERLARDIMAGPVVTIGEDADAREIARLLQTYRIKRVPVIRNGRVVGIVSRADLLRAMVQEPAPIPPHKVARRTLWSSPLAGTTPNCGCTIRTARTRISGGGLS